MTGSRERERVCPPCMAGPKKVSRLEGYLGERDQGKVNVKV